MGIVIAAIVGALVYRFSKGWFSNISRSIGWVWGGKQRSQTMRLIWAAPTGIFMMEASHAPLWLGPLCVLSVFVAQALFGTGQYLRLNPSFERPDLLGFYRNALAVLPVFYFAPHLFFLYALFGACHATIYQLSQRLRGDAYLGDVILGAGSWAIIYSSQWW